MLSGSRRINRATPTASCAGSNPLRILPVKTANLVGETKLLRTMIITAVRVQRDNRSPNSVLQVGLVGVVARMIDDQRVIRKRDLEVIVRSIEK